jgi:hypothetical protein
MAETVIVLDASLSGTVIATAPGWITKLEMTRQPDPPAQVECYLPFPFNRWSSGRFVLNDTAAWPPAMFSFNPTFSGTPGDEFFRGPGVQFRGDLFLECCPVGAEWAMTVSDVEPPRGYT